jgi:hypothetical protein
MFPGMDSMYCKQSKQHHILVEVARNSGRILKYGIFVTCPVTLKPVTKAV